MKGFLPRGKTRCRFDTSGSLGGSPFSPVQMKLLKLSAEQHLAAGNESAA
jgi:hypothetical protein